MPTELLAPDLPLAARLRCRFRAYWFAPTTPFNLGFLRILLFGYLLWLFCDLNSSSWTQVPKMFWREWSRFDLLGLPLASAGTLDLLDMIWRVALVLSCVGLYTRAATATSFVLGIYLLGLPQNFSKISHVPGLLLLTVLVMAVSRCGDALSIDSWLDRRRRQENPTREKPTRKKPVSGEYRWPIRMVWLLMTLAFFGAGFSKLTAPAGFGRTIYETNSSCTTTWATGPRRHWG